MDGVLVVGAMWLALAVLLALLIGRALRLADARDAVTAVGNAPEVVLGPATVPHGFPAPPAPLPASVTDEQPPGPRSAPRSSPTVPGIPAARPSAPGARGSAPRSTPIRKAGLG
jgi:hypothetical protein